MRPLLMALMTMETKGEKQSNDLALIAIMNMSGDSGGDLAPSLGDEKTGKIFADHDFSMRFFSEKFAFSRPKFLMIFFSHRPGFSDFPFVFPDFPYLYYVNPHPNMAKYNLI